MSVSLRLSRGGSKKRPYFRIVAADIRSPRDGKYLERLGTYNPMRPKEDPERVSLNVERIKYWLSVGARPTDKVNNFLAKEGLTKKKEIPNQTKQNQPKKKTLEKIKAKEEKLKSKQDLEDAAKEVASAASEPAAESTKTEASPEPAVESTKTEAKDEKPEASPEPAVETPKTEAKDEKSEADSKS